MQLAEPSSCTVQSLPEHRAWPLANSTFSEVPASSQAMSVNDVELVSARFGGPEHRHLSLTRLSVLPRCVTAIDLQEVVHFCFLF